MSDLIERLRDFEVDGPYGAYEPEITQEAADALEAKDAEIERLRFALQQVWDCEEGGCPNCKLIARATLEGEGE